MSVNILSARKKAYKRKCLRNVCFFTAAVCVSSNVTHVHGQHRWENYGVICVHPADFNALLGDNKHGPDE